MKKTFNNGSTVEFMSDEQAKYDNDLYRSNCPKNYEVLGDIINNDFEHFLVIRDLNNGVSVTNSAKEIIEELKINSPLKQYKGMRVLYFDSQGDLDEIVIKFGKFFGFKSARHLHDKVCKFFDIDTDK